MAFDLKQGEEVLAAIPANLFRGLEAVGGELKVTTARLRFEPHPINFQRAPADIPLEGIARVTPRNTLLIVPNGMLVTMKDGTEHRFVVGKRGWLIDLIRDQILPEELSK